MKNHWQWYLAMTLAMIFFENDIWGSFKDGVFPVDRKKGNIVPVHKKDRTAILIDYCPINLLPIFAKIFRKVIFTSKLECFIEN